MLFGERVHPTIWSMRAVWSSARNVVRSTACDVRDVCAENSFENVARKQVLRRRRHRWMLLVSLPNDWQY